jgi:capsular exopolysaccharide synthesis family protein
MVFLQEYLDDRLNSPDDLENISVLPALAHVPLMPATEPRLVAALPANSHLAESYRALRASIGFAGVDTPIKRLQVTSAAKGEGKSVTSLNLATAMAMDGKRVVLVDADMRRPSLHRMLNLPETPGLSEMLVGMCSVEEGLRPTDVENLQVICAGAIPPNPAELLGSQALDQIIARLEEHADMLIFDSPPCMPVTDPLVIAPRMDGVLLVIHAGNTRKAGVKHVENLLRRARARLLGVVFNQVQADRNGYYYYSYYYSGDGYYSQSEDGKNGKTQRRKLPLGRGHASDAKDDHAEKL